MSLKSALIALAGNVGKCQENARSLKLELERGLLEVADSEINPWTLVKTETGKTKIDIPETAKEIYVEVADSSDVIYMGLIIPCATLKSTVKDFRDGYYANASSYAVAVVDIKNTDAIINNVVKNGTDISTGCTLTVYAR